MAIVKVQSVTGTGATLVLNGVAPGNTLIYIDSYIRAISTGLAAATPADSNGTFTVARAGTPAFFTGGPDDIGTAIWVEQNAAAGTHTVTPEVETGHKGTLVEFSGLLTSGVFDVANDAKTSDSTQTSQVTGTTGATAQADELVIISLCLAASAGLANVALTDPVSGFTTLQVSQNDATDIAMMHAFKVISAIGTQAATFNWVDTEAAQGSHAAIATFKAALAGGVVNLGTSFHPGQSPGLGGISSARFQPSNWWPYTFVPPAGFDPALMAAMNRPWPDTVFSPPQVVASGMTPPEEVPS